jgi:hypothetical protein
VCLSDRLIDIRISFRWRGVRGVRGAEKEREDADCEVHPVGANADDEEDQEGGREGREGYGAEGMGRGFGEDGEVEEWAGHVDVFLFQI